MLLQSMVHSSGGEQAAEQAAVRKVDEECFAWERRGPLLCSTIWKHGADVISLVECDEFEYFKKYLGPRGYDGRWRKLKAEGADDAAVPTPRASSCAAPAGDGKSCIVYGGAGLGNMHAAVLLEEINRWDPSVGVTISVHMSLACSCINWMVGPSGTRSAIRYHSTFCSAQK